METKLNVKAKPEYRHLTTTTERPRARRAGGTGCVEGTRRRWLDLRRRMKGEESLQALSDDQLCHTHTHLPPRFTDEESRLREVTRPEAESHQAAKLEPTGKHHI